MGGAGRRMRSFCSDRHHFGPSLFYGTDRNGTEQFRHIISRNRAAVPTVLLARLACNIALCVELLLLLGIVLDLEVYIQVEV